MLPDEYEALIDRHRRQNRAMLSHLSDAELASLSESTLRSELATPGV